MNYKRSRVYGVRTAIQERLVAESTSIDLNRGVVAALVSALLSVRKDQLIFRQRKAKQGKSFSNLDIFGKTKRIAAPCGKIH
jgi:hypothetical protein